MCRKGYTVSGINTEMPYYAPGMYSQIWDFLQELGWKESKNVFHEKIPG